MKIYTVAFEGPNRCGKGTQIRLLSDYLTKQGVPYLSVRGDGSRNANGDCGNPYSDWWAKIYPEIHISLDEKLWNLAADRLARELVYWRFRYLPQQMKIAKSEVGCLLLDRSILSRAMVCIEKAKRYHSIEELYSCSLDRSGMLKFDVAKICPDRTFLFVATKEVLISRLDENDPKYHFRRQLIEEKHDWYYRYLHYCPSEVVVNTLMIDATEIPSEIHKIILKDLFS